MPKVENIDEDGVCIIYDPLITSQEGNVGKLRKPDTYKDGHPLVEISQAFLLTNKLVQLPEPQLS